MNFIHRRKQHPFSAFYILDHRYGFYVEDHFRERLYLERKRSERTNKPFVLLLVDVKDMAGSKSAAKVIGRITSLLLHTTRETDLKGWYECDAVIGVIFPDLDGLYKIKYRISRTIQNHLYGIAGKGKGEKIRTSFHVFPEADQQPGTAVRFDFPFYALGPKQGDAQKLSLLAKRMMDVGGAAIATVLFSPFFLVLPLLVKWSSPGPVLSKQEGIGRFGRSFHLLAFRSVSTDATGRFLRRTRLDRLPRLFNVIKGDMSFVGPRACLPKKCAPSCFWHCRGVLEMRPGITGPSRIQCDFTPPEEMVRLDLRYVREWSLWTDIKILLKTVSSFQYPVSS